MPKLIANVHQVFAEKELVPGDAIEANEQEARVLIAIGRARPSLPTDELSFAEPVIEQVEAVDPPAPKKRGGTYNRKDLVAEAPVVAEKSVVQITK